MSRALLAFAAALVACSNVDVTIGPATTTKRFTAGDNLDLLFVIDNSASTYDKQTVFAANLPTLASQLDSFPGGRPNVHVGVVSTSVSIGNSNFGDNCTTGDDGALQATARIAGCSPPTDAFISDIDEQGTRVVNYTGTLADTLACIGQLGTTGCGFEAPLESMKRALDGSQPLNAGFLRPDADLGIVVLTDEDDCSVRDTSIFDLPAEMSGPGDYRCQPLYAYDCDHPISATTGDIYTGCKPHHGGYLGDPGDYYSFLTSIKDPSQIVFSVVGGDPITTVATGEIDNPFEQQLALQPSCTATVNGNFAIGRPGLRLDELVHAFGDHGTFETVCQSDYSGALAAIGGKLFAMMSPCLEGDIAIYGGGAPTCTVVEREQLGTAAEVDRAMPACAMRDATTPAPGPRPCWWTVADSATCSTTTTNLAFHVERDAVPPDGTVVDATCELR